MFLHLGIYLRYLICVRRKMPDKKAVIRIAILEIQPESLRLYPAFRHYGKVSFNCSIFLLNCDPLFFNCDILLFNSSLLLGELYIPALHQLLMIVLGVVVILTGFALQAYHLFLAEPVDGGSRIADTVIVFGKHFNFLPCSGFEEGSPVINFVELILVGCKVDTA